MYKVKQLKKFIKYLKRKDVYKQTYHRKDLKVDTRAIRRLAYDGNYQRAIEMLLDIVEKQDNTISKLTDFVSELKVDKDIRDVMKECKRNPQRVLEALSKDD